MRVITCCQCIEERTCLVQGAEDDVGIAILINRTAPLGATLNFFAIFKDILVDTVDEVAVEAIAPLTFRVTAKQDVVARIAFVNCIDDPLQVVNLLLDRIIVEIKVVRDVLVGTTDEHRAWSNIFVDVTVLPSRQAL